MRDFWICDADGAIAPELGHCGLPTDVWSALYPRLAGDSSRPILAALWQEHWGPEAEARFTPEEVSALGAELESLAEELDDEPAGAVYEFCAELAELCAHARSLTRGLRVVAD